MNLTFFLISSPDSGLVMLFVQAITLTSSFFLLDKITAISNFTNFLYNAYICVLSPVLFLRDTFVVPRLKNRSTGFLRGHFLKIKTGAIFCRFFN